MHAICKYMRNFVKYSNSEMKIKIFCILAAILTFVGALRAQSGPWSGKLDVGGNPLTLVFHFDEDGCTMDSPDQGAKGIKAELRTTALGKLEIQIPSIGASFEGVFFSNTISGYFRQGGFLLPLTLKPGIPELRRPQTPTGPFPYKMEEVSFQNGTATLKGTLTLPLDCNADTPAVLLVTGSGLQNRNEEIYGHKPFAVIADALARAGIATLRYDDRGFRESTGDIVNMTTEDLKNDAGAGVEMLRAQFRKVGVAGHSEGGSIAFMLAAEKKVDFVISLAGGIIPMKETMLEQNYSVLREMNYPETTIDEYVKAISVAFDDIMAGRNPGGVEGTDLPTDLKQNYRAAVLQCRTPYMRYFISMDIRKILDKVSCPVLAFNGTLDSQVNCSENIGALRKALPDGQATTVEVEGANHLFQHCKTGSASEYKEIEETIAPEVLEGMTEWIKSNIITAK